VVRKKDTRDPRNATHIPKEGPGQGGVGSLRLVPLAELAARGLRVVLRLRVRGGVRGGLCEGGGGPIAVEKEKHFWVTRKKVKL